MLMYITINKSREEKYREYQREQKRDFDNMIVYVIICVCVYEDVAYTEKIIFCLFDTFNQV